MKRADEPDATIRILGLDPGSRHTGFGVIDSKAGRLIPIRFGRFSTNPRAELPSRLAQLASDLDSLLDEFRPSRAALESPFKGLNPRSLIVLSQARGVLLAVLAKRGLSLAEYTPTEVKSAVSGYGRADKAQVGQMVRRILGLGEQIPTVDAADALAVAICCANRSRIDRLQERPGS